MLIKNWQLKKQAIATNKDYASKWNIPQSTAITCVKPSGTVSQLVDSASGIHTRHSPYYIRTVRCDTKDPLTSFMIEQGFPNEPDVTNPDSVTRRTKSNKVPIDKPKEVKIPIPKRNGDNSSKNK